MCIIILEIIKEAGRRWTTHPSGEGTEDHFEKIKGWILPQNWSIQTNFR